jgi:predicted ATPase
MREEPFFTHVRLRRDDLDPKRFPLSVPAVAMIDQIRFHPAVTVFAGENGSGKSTLIEAIAIAAGFNAEGGRKSFRTESDTTDNQLAEAITLARNPGREQDGFFLRGESAYVMMNYINELHYHGSYGGNLHHRSHGESFMQIFYSRFGEARNALYILDEIESALSPQRQLEFLILMHEHVQRGSSFIISTHSPILMSYPKSRLYWLGRHGVEERDYRETEHFRVYKGFISRPDIVHQMLGEKA